MAFSRVNADHCDEMAEKDKVDNLPTLIYYKQGKRICTVEGIETNQVEKKIDEFVEKLSNMLKMIESNDASVKAEVKDKFDTQERSMAKMRADLMNGAAPNQVVTSASVKTLKDNARNEIDSIKNPINNQTGRLGQMEVEGQPVASRIAMIEISIGTLQANTINEVSSVKAY